MEGVKLTRNRNPVEPYELINVIQILELNSLLNVNGMTDGTSNGTHRNQIMTRWKVKNDMESQSSRIHTSKLSIQWKDENGTFK
mmetsp:Transcript_30521/g.46235  ORF Transcript_30521/g.46235 Transcript_30521/m.46235 type:complete len:84 (-) Transcript_30521:102-353(-)